MTVAWTEIGGHKDSRRHKPVVGVTNSIWDLEYSIHECPHAHKREVAAIFPGVDPEGAILHMGMLTVPNGLSKSSKDFPVTREDPWGRGGILSGMLVVPTCQHARLDLVRMGDTVEGEKDRLLEQFVEWARAVSDRLIQQGHWADYIDPSSGLPMVNRQGMTPYGEVDGLATLLGYKTANAGCCKILLHPKWGSAVYPASLFTKAPLDSLLAAIRQAEQELQDMDSS